MIRLDPKDVHALTNKGVSLNKLGNYTGAINPKHENALYKGLVLDNLGNDTGALTYLDKVRMSFCSIFNCFFLSFQIEVPQKRVYNS